MALWRASTWSPGSFFDLVWTSMQITTCRGVVSGRLRSQQRQLEVELMRFCFRKLGVGICHNFTWATLFVLVLSSPCQKAQEERALRDLHRFSSLLYLL